jgi:hypothetical protein
MNYGPLIGFVICIASAILVVNVVASLFENLSRVIGAL